MATEDDYFRLIFEVQNREELDRFWKGLDSLGKAQADVTGLFREGAASEEQLAAATSKLSRDTYDLAGAYDLLDDSEAKAARAAQSQAQAAREAAAANEHLNAVLAQVEAEVLREAQALLKAGAASSQHGKAVNDASGKTAGLNTAVRNLGYGLSDVFSNNGPIGQKLGGFANNVGNIVTGILQTAGKLGPWGLALAAGLEIAFTASGALMTAFGLKTLDDFKNLFTGGTKIVQDESKKIEDRIKELTEKPYLIDIEIKELDNALKRARELKEILSEVEALKRSQTTEQKKSGEAVAKAVKDATNDRGEKVGAPGLEAAIAGPILADLNKQTEGTAANEQAVIQKKIEAARKRAEAAAIVGAEAQQQAAEMEQGAGEAELKAARQRLADQKELNKKIADQKAANLTLAAREGNETTTGAGGIPQSQAQAELARRAAAAGFHDVAGQVRMHSAEYEAEAEKARESIKEGNERAAEKAEREKKAAADAKKADKLADTLNKQGQTNQDAAARAAEAQAKKDQVEAKKKADAEKHRADQETKAGEALAKQYSATSDVDEQAAALARQVHAAGGAVDGKGRFRPMNAAQQQQYLQAAVSHYLRTQFGVGAQNASLAAGPLAMNALGGLPMLPAAPRARPQAQAQPRRRAPKAAPKPPPKSGYTAAAKPQPVRRAPRTASNTQIPLNDQLVANQAKLSSRLTETEAKLKRTLTLAQQVGRNSDQQTRSNQNSGSV